MNKDHQYPYTHQPGEAQYMNMSAIQVQCSYEIT